MRVLIGDKDHVDFAAPVEMTDAQQGRFLDFLKREFAVVEEIDDSPFRTARLGSQMFMTEWTSDELAHLLKLERPTDQVAQELGRTWMSANLKRGYVLSVFLPWAKEKGKDPFKGDTKALIEQFLKEKRDEVLKRREQRKKERREIEELQEYIEQLEYELEILRSSEHRERLELLKRLHQINMPDIDEYLKNKQKIIGTEIEQAKQDLGSYQKKFEVEHA